LREFRFQRIDR
jgi:hypothetical protein